MLADHPFLTSSLAMVVVPLFVLTIVLRKYSSGTQRDRQVVLSRQWYLFLLVPLVWVVSGSTMLSARDQIWDNMLSRSTTVELTLPLVLPI